MIKGKYLNFIIKIKHILKFKTALMYIYLTEAKALVLFQRHICISIVYLFIPSKLKEGIKSVVLEPSS